MTVAGSGAEGGGPAGRPAPPHVQVVRGTPDDVELAALVAGLVAAVGTAHDADPAPAPAAAGSDWSDRSRTVPGAGAVWRTGGDAWRRSLR